MTLTSLRSPGWVFCRISWDMSDVFLMFRQGLWFWGRKNHRPEVPFSSHTVVMTYPCCCWPWLPGWGGVCQISLLRSCSPPLYPIPYSHCPPWRKVTVSFIFPLHFIDCSLHAWLCWGLGIWTHVRCKTRPLLCGQCSEDKGGPLTACFPLLCFCALSEFSKRPPFLSTIKFKFFFFF